jgi:hypothetical protein
MKQSLVQDKVRHLCQLVEVPEPVVCGMDRAVAYVMFDVQTGVLYHNV